MVLSIVIVNWNAKQHLKNCLDSLIPALSGIENEIIVVDNASEDGSVEFIRSSYANLTLICNKQNLGFAKANNIGIRNCSGRAIFLINSDVVVFGNCFKDLISFLDTNCSVGLVGPKILDKNGLLQRSIMEFPTISNNITRAFALDNIPKIKNIFSTYLTPLSAHNRIKQVDIVNGCFIMARRKAIEDVGLLDERFFIYGEDIDWCKRFNDKGWRVLYYPNVSVVHFGGGSSSNAPIKFYLEMLKANCQLWRKYYNAKYAKIYLLILIIHHLNRFIGFNIIFLLKPALRSNSIFKIKQNISAIKWAMNEIVNQ